MPERTNAELLTARAEKRQQYVDEAAAKARRMGRSLTCTDKPVEWHGTCSGLRAAFSVDLGCLCECHDADLLADPQAAAEVPDGEVSDV